MMEQVTGSVVFQVNICGANDFGTKTFPSFNPFFLPFEPSPEFRLVNESLVPTSPKNNNFLFQRPNSYFSLELTKFDLTTREL